MLHEVWDTKESIKKVKCIKTDAKKYIVNNVLTVGKVYEVKNETDEFLFVVDNTNKIAGFYKEYFEDVTSE
jgi:hypothetical protein